MKVILINGSPRELGCTYTALSEVERGLTDHGVGSEVIHIGTHDIPGCRGCFACRKLGKGYRMHHAFTEEMESCMPLMRRFINLYSYARLRHCLSEPVVDPPEWMEHLLKRLRSKRDHLEKTVTP